MKIQLGAAMLIASASIVYAANFGGAIIAYNPGEGYATDFATGAGYTNAAAALGEISKSTPPPFASAVTPYNPPYGFDNIVSIGAGGLLTIQFSSPVKNSPLNPFGLDFIVFGNAGFIVTNNVYTDLGVTSGALFGANSGVTEVWVSADNVTYYQLAPTMAAQADGYYPTDASGAASVPVNPTLKAADFSGKNLAGIRELYNGSAGGTGFDISHARTISGLPAPLQSIQFVQFRVTSGVIEVDAISAVSEGNTIREDFSRATDWRTFGNASLFDVADGQLVAEWDSNERNSYFYRPLGRTLRKRDTFSAQLDLHVESITVDHANFYAFEIALGFFNESKATQLTFDRSSGIGSPNLVEWDYFPDTGFGATIAPAIASTNSQFESAFTFPLELTPGAYTLRMEYNGTNQTLRTQMTRNGEPFGTIKDVKLTAAFTDFEVDAFGALNYFDQSDDGRVQARARIDNVLITLPAKRELRLTGRFAESGWEVEFMSEPSVRYQLEWSADLRTWMAVGEKVAGTGEPLKLRDPHAKARAYYRVAATP